MSQYQHSSIQLISGRHSFNVDLAVPRNLIAPNYDLWAQALTEESSWITGKHSSPPFIAELKEHEQLFIISFLRLSQLFCELGRLPIFDIPTITSLTPDVKSHGRYVLKLELPLFDFIPYLAYQTPIKAALAVSSWMAQNTPTKQNLQKVFNTIEQKVIKPLLPLVPAGKSTMPILKVAHSIGIPFLHLGLGVYQLGWGSKARRLHTSMIDIDSAIGSRLAQNKISTANLLKVAGLPAPTHLIAVTEHEAIQAVAKIGFPVVVKPSDRDRGEGVTVNILDISALKLAFSLAHKLSLSKQVIIERQAPGVCHRLFIANDRLLYAIKRLPISVTGDGIRTVHQLVDAEVESQAQRPPWERSQILPIDELAIKVLAQEGLTPQSVPADGAIVSLRPIESMAWGGTHEDVTNTIHPDNLSAAITAARLFGLHVAGIDIISPDITKSWVENGAIINEVNFAPLLGRTQITKSYISNFLSEFITKDNAIPIEIVELEQAGLKKHVDFVKQGLRSFYTSSDKTIDWRDNVVAMPLNDLNQRINALIRRSDVDALVILQ